MIKSNYSHGISVFEPHSIYINNSIIQDNAGNGINIHGSYYNSSGGITNNTIRNNKGSGIYLADHDFSIINNLIYGNVAKKGGGIRLTTAKPLLLNNTIINNKANQGAGIYGWIWIEIKVYNCILRNNESNEGKQLLYDPKVGDHDGTFHGDFYYNNIEGITDEDITGDFVGNIDQDALFVDPAGSDFHLTDISPCINTGTPDVTGLDIPETDLDGNPRIQDLRIDMGVYEYTPSSSTSFEQLQDNLSDNNLLVFPNPTKGLLYLTVKEETMEDLLVTITDMQGRLLFKEKLDCMEPDQVHSIHMDTFLPGVYMLKVNGRTIRVVKE
jgi:hypothetical protein